MTIRRILGVAAWGAVIGAGAFLPVFSAEKDSPKEAPDAARRMAQMEARISQLEARIAELERKPPVIAVPPERGPYSAIPQPAPDNWTPKEINGLRYYIIPLQGSQAGRK